MTELTTIGVIGLGTIGASWASLFLARGLTIRCHDPAPDAERAVRNWITRAWPTLAQLVSVEPFEEAIERFTFHSSASSAALGCDFIQESAPERLDIKQALLAEIEKTLGPDVVIASSTSGLMPTTMQTGMTRPERFLVGHPFNPPHIMPLVEVVGGQATSESAVDAAKSFYGDIGKRAIHIRKEVVGHVANRLQAALWREAVHLALEGVASVADIDAAVVAGPGARWAIMGPHLTLHLAGGEGGIAHFIEHLGPAFETWWQDLGKPVLDHRAKNQLAVGLGALTTPEGLHELIERRDEKLIALLRLSPHLL